MSEGQKPSIGRIVHWYARDAENWLDGQAFAAAIITRVNDDDTVNVTVFPDGPPPFGKTHIPYGQAAEAADRWFWWQWPERV